MLQLLASLALLAQSVGPGYVPPPVNTPPYYICLNDPGTSVNLRSGPGTGHRKINTLRQSDGAWILDQSISPQDGMRWDKIRTNTNKIGWVRDDYVCSIYVRY